MKNNYLRVTLTIFILLSCSCMFADDYTENGGAGGYGGGDDGQGGHNITYQGGGGFSYIGNGISITSIQHDLNLTGAGQSPYNTYVVIYQENNGSGSNNDGSNTHHGASDTDSNGEITGRSRVTLQSV